MNKKKSVRIFIISLAIICGIAVIAVIAFFIMAGVAFDPGKNYSISELINSFRAKQKEINTAREYYKTIVPKYKKVDIEFDGDGKIARLEIAPVDTGRGSDLTAQFSDWNLTTRKTDSISKVLGWSQETLNQLRQKLKNADCISISNGDYTTIGFKRSGLGMYFFDVFDKPIPDSLKSRYNDSCTYIYVNKNLVLEYGGGAVGRQCFFNTRIK